jgi:hypothetical protein
MRAISMPTAPDQHALSHMQNTLRIGDLSAPRWIGGNVKTQRRTVSELYVGSVNRAMYGEVTFIQPLIPRPLILHMRYECVAPIKFP